MTVKPKKLEEGGVILSGDWLQSSWSALCSNNKSWYTCDMLSKIGKTFSAAQIRKYPGHGTPACVSYPGRALAYPTTPPGFDTYLCVPWPGYLRLCIIYTLSYQKCRQENCGFQWTTHKCRRYVCTNMTTEFLLAQWLPLPVNVR